MTPERIAHYGDELYAALRRRAPVAPLTAREPDLTLDDAYHISLRLLARRTAPDAGGRRERVIGKKIGVTSKAVQTALDVHQPDFGYLTDAMRYESGCEIPISRTLIQPRAEGEIAFVLKRDLAGPGVTAKDVLGATECVLPCFEIVDSRIVDWKIRIADTVADNASSGLFMLGDEPALPSRVDFIQCAMTVEKNGAVISTGTGAGATGSPLDCVAWLANTLGRYGTKLCAGEIILSGSLVPLEPVVAGDAMRVRITGVGAASVRFV